MLRRIMTNLLYGAVILFIYVIFSSAYAGEMTNKLKGLYDTQKAVYASDVTLCVQDAHGNFIEWDYGTQIDPNEISGNQYYFGAAVRTGGCSESDIYYGYLSVSGDEITYSYTEGAHITLQNTIVSDGNLVGNLEYTLIGAAADSSLPYNKNPNESLWFAGINLSGLEFSTMPNASVIPSLSEADKYTSYTDLDDTATFLNQGANIIRIPLRWAYLVPYGYDDYYFDARYFDLLVVPTLETITEHDYFAIVDLHSYMHYATVGNQVAGCGGPDEECPDGMLITDTSVYADVWSNIWQEILKYKTIDSSKLFFDLANEPATKDGEDLTAKQAFDMQVAVIKRLNNEGFNGYYLVEGISWTGLHSWESSGNSLQFTRENFKQAGISDETLSKIIINVHQYLDANFSGTSSSCIDNITTADNLNQFVSYLELNKFKAMITEFGVGSDQSSCETALDDFLNQIKNNAYTTENDYGFIGWTVWSTGHGWGGYNLRVKPDDWKDNILVKYFTN